MIYIYSVCVTYENTLYLCRSPSSRSAFHLPEIISRQRSNSVSYVLRVSFSTPQNFLERHAEQAIPNVTLNTELPALQVHLHDLVELQGRSINC